MDWKSFEYNSVHKSLFSTAVSGYKILKQLLFKRQGI